MADPTSTRRGLLGDTSGAVADLGVLVPLLAALVARNGLDAATALVGVGALYVVAGLWFRVPVPVQPIKAAAAIAVARDLPASHLASAGIVLGVLLVILGTTGLAGVLARVFSPPVVRGIQLGVGLLLVRSALVLAGPVPFTRAMALVVALALLLASRDTRPVAAIVVGAGVLWSLATSPLAELPRGVALWQPEVSAASFEPAVLLSALVVLVVPQLPLTFGNAVVALADLEHRYFGHAARRVTPRSVSISSGVANVVAGTLGGMPMCHGSGGLTAHYRAGARTARMNLVIGVPLLVAGLFLAPMALGLLALVPFSVLAGLLLFTGVAHAALVADQRGYELSVALLAGVAGGVTANLAVSLAVGITLYWGHRWVRAARARRAGGGVAMIVP